jgi:predicted small integral membrane protein
MEGLAWMAWSPPTAVFFVVILSLLASMTYLALRSPELPRVGALGIATTRGDRLFISLLSAAFIHLIGVGTIGADPLFTIGGIEVSRLWIATLVSLGFATWVFKRV